MSGATPLSRCRVLDVSESVGASYCARLLGDMGADVIKVERPALGDPTRRRGPFPGGVPDLEMSGLFLWLNLNKRGVTLDLRSTAGSSLFRSLCASADVVVTSQLASELEVLGLTYDELSARFPLLVVASVTGFGLSGPNAEYASTEIIAAATSGQLFIQGDRGQPPLKTAGQPFEHAAGVHAAIGILSALWVRDAIGRGQLVDVAVQESAAHFTQMAMTWYTHLGVIQGRIGSRMPFGHPFTILPCLDGYVAITHLPQSTEMLTVLTGIQAFSSDPRFLDPLDRLQHANEMDELLMQWTMQHTKDEIVQQGQQLRMAFDYVNEIPELLEDEQLTDRGAFEAIDFSGGTVTVPRPPFRMLAVDSMRRAPRLGEHNWDVFSDLAGCGGEELFWLEAAGVI